MKLWAILPELVLAGLCLALVPVAGLVRGRARGAPAWVAGAGLVVCLVLTARTLSWAPVPVFEGAYAVDGFGAVFKLLVLAGALIALLVMAGYFRGRPPSPHAPVALLFSTLGAVAVTSAIDLALVLLFLQMTSMAGYVLVALVRADGRALEAALKIFIYGAVALAVMAYGLSFVYGLTGSLDLRRIGPSLAAADPVWVALAFLLALVGYGFEATVAPFHFWAPDVYQGATAPVAGFLSVVPKIGGFAALLRFVTYALEGGPVSGRLVLAALAALTMTLGNLAALRQESLKRLLAWSSVAQAGYVLAAVAAAGRADGALPAVGYYLAAYVFMNLAAFAAVSAVERTAGTDALGAFEGLGRRAPFTALALTLGLLSLAGVPPLAGYVGKVLVLGATIDGGLPWLAALAAANFVVGLYYYLRVVARVYLRAPGEAAAPRSHPAALTLGVAGMLALGVVPGPFVDLLGATRRWLE